MGKVRLFIFFFTSVCNFWPAIGQVNDELKNQIIAELSEAGFEIPRFMQEEIIAIGGLHQFYFDVIDHFLEVRHEIPRMALLKNDSVPFRFYHFELSDYEFYVALGYDLEEILNAIDGKSFSKKYIPQRTGPDISPEYTRWRNDKEYYEDYSIRRFNFLGGHLELACNGLKFRNGQVKKFSLPKERKVKGFNKAHNKIRDSLPEILDSLTLANLKATPTVYTFFRDDIKVFDSLAIQAIKRNSQSISSQVMVDFEKISEKVFKNGNLDWMRVYQEEGGNLFNLAREIARNQTVFEKFFDYSDINRIKPGSLISKSRWQEAQNDSTGYSRRAIIAFYTIIRSDRELLNFLSKEFDKNGATELAVVELPDYDLLFDVYLDEKGELQIPSGDSYSEIVYDKNDKEFDNYNTQRLVHYRKRFKEALHTAKLSYGNRLFLE